MRALPSGTVTFLFTDVEGSTRLLARIGSEAYAAALAESRRILRRATAAHIGVEVDTQGDGFFAAFPTAPAALATAVDVQEALTAGPVRVRMGLHTGTPLLTDEGYVGADVHRAARIAAAGSGGQILLSQATRDLVDGDIRDLGLHRLKDISAPERVYQLGSRTFPPLKSLFRTNLPVAVTEFVGREREVAEIVRLLKRDRVRLLTLTGPGGSGKTRLALEAATELSEAFPDGAFWIGLAALGDPRSVLATIAGELRAESDPVGEIGDKRMLLVLDNFEHLLPAAEDVAALLRACPQLVLIATSRQRVRIAGEHVYDVPGLSERDAVSLFVRRAHAVSAEQADDQEVVAVCRRLDGLPLAIELAAARVGALPVAAIRERLDRRLPVLGAGPRDAPERQRTLQATIEWSYDLLDRDDRRLFARLATFRGSWTFEAAVEVCDADLDGLASLIEKSLVRRSGDRYSMLETIREYALERLEAGAEASTLRRAHAEWYCRLARRTDLPTRERNEEFANFRAALEFLLEARDVDAALELASDLDPLWRHTTHLPEGRRWLEQGLAADGASPTTRARALGVLGWLAMEQGDHGEALTFLQRSLRMSRDVGDERRAAEALGRLGTLFTQTGEYTKARESLEEGLAINTARGNHKGQAFVLNALAILAAFEGDFAASRQWLEDQLRLRHEMGDSTGVAASYANLGFDAVLRRDYDEADAFLRKALAHARDEGELAKAPLLTTLGRLEIGRGRLEAARIYLGDALETYRVSGARARCAECFEGFARIALASDDSTRAARLLGAASAIRQRAGVRLSPREEDVFEDAVQALAVADDDELRSAWREGQEMRIDDLVLYALEPDEHDFLAGFEPPSRAAETPHS